MLPFDDATTLSLTFHLNSEPWLNADAYGTPIYEVDCKTFPNATSVALPPPHDSPLRRLLLARASCREFAPRRLALAGLATLLADAYGIARYQGALHDGSFCQMRTTPSAGGLFPLELYVMTQQVEGLPDGVHHYDVRAHALDLLKPDVSLPAIEPFMLTWPFLPNVNVIVFLAAVFRRSQKKYGPRGYRYILLEAGHVAQTLCLAAAERGLGTLCMGGFRDARLNHWLGFDGIAEAVVYSVAIGHPDQHTAPD
jgi:SagB-type dehydrogenase family enzyme